MEEGNMHTSFEQHSSPSGWQRHLMALALPLAVLLVMPSTSIAQSATDEEDRSGRLEEVIVTATRREESLMDVAIAVTAISGDDLEAFGITDIISLTQMSPNTTLEVSRGTNTTLSAFIRGVGQQDPVPGFEAGVGIYLDDVYLNRPQAAVMDIYDVERIEVLRGPQGTLYGRNTIGGAVRYVTRRLADTPELSAKVSYGTDNLLDLVLTGSTPVSDTFKVGGSLVRFTRDGFGDNLNLEGIENYAKDSWGARVSAEWQATDRLFFRLTGDYIEDDSDPRQGHRLTVGKLTGAPILDDVFDTRSGLNNPIQYVEAKGAALLAEWKANDMVTIKNIVSYREDETWSPIDFDSLPAADLDVPVTYQNDQTSEELQLLLSGESWKGLLGFYYLDATAFTAFDVILGTTGDLIGLPGLNAFTLGDVDTETWSVFGDFTYDFTEQWSVSVGGRYTEDKRSSRVLRQTMIGGTSAFFGGSAIPIVTTSDFHGAETFDKFTPRVSLSWQPNDDNTLYVTYSEGFKGGGFDPRGQTSLAPDLDGDGVVSEADVFEFMEFDPETVETIEFGIKSSLFNERMTSNISVFFSSYTDVQIPGSVGRDTNGDGIEDTFVGVTTNAADADINGVEWEGQAILAEDFGKSGSSLRFSWAVGYLDAKFNEFIDAFGNDVADERVFQNTPEWTAMGMLNYSVPLELFGTDGSLAIITSLAYRDDHSQFEVPTPQLDQDAYSLWDLSVVWSDSSGHWTAGIHGKNLTDKEYKVAGYFFPSLGLESSITAFYGNPRQVWGTVQYKWF
jgi:iron complex outermembrane receptor protein